MKREVWFEGAEAAPGVRVYRNALLAASHVRELVLTGPRGSLPYVVLPFVWDETVWVESGPGGEEVHRLERGEPFVLWFAGALDRIAEAVKAAGRWVDPEVMP